MHLCFIFKLMGFGVTWSFSKTRDDSTLSNIRSKFSRVNAITG